ncbi:hypothetical protein RHSIM_Rhsim12G0010500 [Rhododendron simsii]|uniref:Uncharacterized protein n=1 Tax=Rhododendron simsii TaxID=118357 RepID=A0A834G209_RHOSS|nr:hypothetical protein RHSIM_Rhsim12G0010500 [Rhododendron simsii]
MPIFGAHTPSLKPRSSVVPTTVGGEGVEVPGGAALEEVLRLLERVIYYSSGGQMQSDDIPSPEHMELALPPSVQQVSRKFVDKSFYCISGLSVLVRQKSMVIEGLETRGQRVAAAGRSASAPRGGRGSAMGRDDETLGHTKELGAFVKFLPAMHLADAKSESLAEILLGLDAVRSKTTTSFPGSPLWLQDTTSLTCRRADSGFGDRPIDSHALL